MASAFTPKDGRVQAWSTSSDEISTRIGRSIGSTIRLSVSSSRNWPGDRSWVGIIYESNVRSS